MIKLESKTMTKAIERAKAIRPRVRVISATNRTYSVTGSKGDAYTVRFAVVNGLRLGECDCKAGRRGQVCYHLSAAAQVNVMVQSMRRAPMPISAPTKPADERANLITDIKTTWRRKHPHTSLGDALMARFGVNNPAMLSVDFLRRVQVALNT